MNFKKRHYITKRMTNDNIFCQPNPASPLPMNTLRKIRSFVRREGRLTKQQQHALQSYWDDYGLDLTTDYYALDTLFPHAQPVVLEIGFGNGVSLLSQAQQQPEHNFIGIEVHRPGVGHLLWQLHELQLPNVKIFCADALDVLQQCIADHSLQRVQIFFPDPWPKKRHHKRRLVQVPFIQLLHQKLCSQGELHIATDWQDYAEHVLQVMQNFTQATPPLFCNAAGEKHFLPRPASRPLTKFEQRGQRLGHTIFDLIFNKSTEL
jgi:tRNA (guanine-N7-)-methyltransferase